MKDFVIGIDRMEMKDFVIGIGRINIDMIYSGLERLPSLGEEVYSKGFEIHLGGGAPGEAVILSKLGVPAKIITWLGSSMFAEIARSEFRIGNPEIIDLYQGNGNPLVLSSAMLCEGDRTFLSWCDEVTPTDADIERIRREHRDAKIVLLSPLYPEIYEGLNLTGSVKIFDTGWEDDLSHENPKYHRFLEQADYYLPNRREALKMTGTASVDEAAEVLSHYFEHVIIKVDSEGCLIRDAEGTRVIPPLRGIEAVDATGAGDAFLSGFTYGVYHGYSVDDCVRFGNITGGTCVQAYGCLTKTLTESELLSTFHSL